MENQGFTVEDDSYGADWNMNVFFHGLGIIIKIHQYISEG